MKKINSNFVALFCALSLFFMASTQGQAQGLVGNSTPQWLQNNGNVYVAPTVKVGIGTSTPARNLDIANTSSTYLRLSSSGGAQAGSQTAGIELRRVLSNGSNTTWSLTNEGEFKINNNGVGIFSLHPGLARIGVSLNNPTQLVVNGANVEKIEGTNTIYQGGIRLYSKLGSTTHGLHMDGNQIESETALYLNHALPSDILLANGGGKVKVNTTDGESRLNIASNSDMQLKLINTGTGGGSWRIGASNNNWVAGGGKFIISKSSNTADAALVINSNNSVGIGTTTPNSAYRLSVNGKIRAKEIIVETGWADFVFEKDYVLRPLEEVEAYIQANKHLPDVPSAKIVEANGVSVGEMEATLLRKVEELTLYLIALKKENAALAERIHQLEN